MAFRPLRQKRLVYVESIELDPHTNLPVDQVPDAEDKTHHSLLNSIFDKIAETFAGHTDERPKYLVKLEERDESHLKWYQRQGAVTWIEKATQRDFAIGSSIGALAGTCIVAASGGALALGVIGAMALTGGLIGGVSDYINNTNEMENGAIIEPPQHFNRDAVKYALGWAGAAKLAMAAGTIALHAAGLSAVAVIPEVVGALAVGAGAVYGAIKGSHAGYERMEQEYTCAVIKNQRPELGVSIKKDVVNGVDDLAIGAGLAVTSAIAPMVGASTSASAPMITASSTAAVGNVPQRGASMAQSFAQTEQASPIPDSVGLDTLRYHEQQTSQPQLSSFPDVIPPTAQLQEYAKGADQRVARAVAEDIPLESQETTKFREMYPSKAGQALALPQAKESGYRELLATQQPANWSLQAS
jgi:hypothetical protein